MFALALLAAGTAATGCLPRGEPPAGQQLVADRTSVLEGMVASTGDGMVRVLVTRPGLNPQPGNANLATSDLYVVEAPASGGAPSERLLATGILGGLINGGCPLGQSTCYPTDARGRVFVNSAFDLSTGNNEVSRIDPVTGDRFVLPSSVYTLSPSGRRLLVFAPITGGTGPTAPVTATLYEADDRATVFESTGATPFIGEDLYYVTPQQELTRIAPGGTPEILTTGIAQFGPIPPASVLMILARPSANPDVSMYTYSIFDPATLKETPSPFGDNQFNTAFNLTASPDGRWVLSVNPSRDLMEADYTFLDLATGAQDVLELPGYFGITNSQWRPGRAAELWIGSGQTDQQTIWIKQAGGPAVSTPGLPFYLTEATHLSSPGGFLTPDGAYWFSQRVIAGTPTTNIQVASADDPAGPRFDLVLSNETELEYWQLPDGRILMPTYKKAPNRSDIYAFDPRTGEKRLMGEAGRVTAVGRTRMLATVHVIDDPGDLVAVDLASGRQTLLAPEFTVDALVEAQGGDLAAPGAHVAYRFLARFESPYDGIWVATIP